MPSLFRSLVQGVVRATVQRGVAREVRAQQQLRATDVRDAWQHSFRDAIAFANRMRAESPAYRDRLKREGLDSPITAESWNDLPVLTKDDFRRDTDSWFGEPVRTEKVKWTYTSGSTGEPFKFPLSKASQTAEMAANELNLHASAGSLQCDAPRSRSSRTHPGVCARSITRSWASTRSAFAAAEFRMEHVPAMVERLRRERISYLRGYSSSVYLFAQEVLRRGLTCAHTVDHYTGRRFVE